MIPVSGDFYVWEDKYDRIGELYYQDKLHGQVN